MLSFITQRSTANIAISLIRAISTENSRPFKNTGPKLKWVQTPTFKLEKKGTNARVGVITLNFPFGFVNDDFIIATDYLLHKDDTVGAILVARSEKPFGPSTDFTEIYTKIANGLENYDAIERRHISKPIFAVVRDAKYSMLCDLRYYAENDDLIDKKCGIWSPFFLTKKLFIQGREDSKLPYI